LETYHNKLLETLNDAGLVKRIREEERRLKNAATAPTPPTPLKISPATVRPQVTRNARHRRRAVHRSHREWSCIKRETKLNLKASE
jgi:hypothetical protein